MCKIIASCDCCGRTMEKTKWAKMKCPRLGCEGRVRQVTAIKIPKMSRKERCTECKWQGYPLGILNDGGYTCPECGASTRPIEVAFSVAS